MLGRDAVLAQQVGLEVLALVAERGVKVDGVVAQLDACGAAELRDGAAEAAERDVREGAAQVGRDVDVDERRLARDWVGGGVGVGVGVGVRVRVGVGVRVTVRVTVRVWVRFRVGVGVGVRVRVRVRVTLATRRPR